MNLDGIGFVEAIVIDVSDLAIGAAFWGTVTGKEVGPSFEPNFLRARSESGFDLVLQEVADVKTGKSRMHLDIQSGEHRDRLGECDGYRWKSSRSC